MEESKELKIAEDFYHYVCLHTTLSKPKVLEVGCGYGRAATYMCQIAGQLTLIDTDKKVIDYMSTHQVKNRDNIQVKCMYSDQVKGPFDMVYYFLSLHHIVDIPAELEQAKKLLNLNGQLYICEYIPIPSYPLHRYDQVPHEGFAINELKRELVRNKFSIINIDEISTLNHNIGDKQVKYIIYGMTAKKE